MNAHVRRRGIPSGAGTNPGGARLKQQDGQTGAKGRGGADGGFTLVETLIAFAIAAMAIAALVHGTTGAVLSSRMAGRYDEAVGRAKSHLAALLASPLIDSDRQGDEGAGFHWRVRVATAAAAPSASRLKAVPPGVVTLYRITVTVSWADGDHRHAVRLDSARLGPLA